MIHRFRRSPATSEAPITSAFSSCSSEVPCQCCAAIARAREEALFDCLPEWNSPLTPGVQLVNISHREEERKLRVDLSTDWARMFSQIPLIGEGLTMTRNAVAILGRRMPYPELHITCDGVKGASGEGGLWLDFRHLCTARAIHARRDGRHVFGIEFADDEGNLVHRFTLTPESQVDEFFAWVRLHQACSALAAEIEHVTSQEAALVQPHCPTRRTDSGSLASIVATCVNREIPLRFTVASTAVTQQAIFTPVSLQRSSEWWFASDDLTGVHFSAELFDRIVVETHTDSTGTMHSVLRGTLEGEVGGLAIEAGHPDARECWHTLLEEMA